MKKLLLALVLSLTTINLNAAITPNGEYKLDKAHAHIGFKVSHLGFSFVVGRFNTFDGKFKFEAGGNSSVNFSIETKSIDTNNEKRDNHLRSDDFFDAELFTEITFVSNKVNYTQSGDPKEITGILNLLGEEKEVTFNVVTVGAGDSRGKIKAGYTATTKIDRRDFDMGGFAGVVGNEVEITVNLEIEKI